MHNSAMRSQSHRSGGPPPPPPMPENSMIYESSSWGADLRDMLIGAVVASGVFATGTMLLSATGMLRYTVTSNRFIEPEITTVSMVAVGGPLLWTFILVKFTRVNGGFRIQGLASLMLVGTLMATLVQLLLMLLWPLVVNHEVPVNSVIAQYNAEPLAFAVGAVYVLALFAWSAICALGFAGQARAPRIAGVIGWILMLIGGFWFGMKHFEQPATYGSFLLWAGIALVGLVLVPLIAAARSRTNAKTAVYVPRGG